jgi:hypothetical protein
VETAGHRGRRLRGARNRSSSRLFTSPGLGYVADTMKMFTPLAAAAFVVCSVLFTLPTTLAAASSPTRPNDVGGRVHHHQREHVVRGDGEHNNDNNASWRRVVEEGGEAKDAATPLGSTNEQLVTSFEEDPERLLSYSYVSRWGGASRARRNHKVRTKWTCDLSCLFLPKRKCKKVVCVWGRAMEPLREEAGHRCGADRDRRQADRVHEGEALVHRAQGGINELHATSLCEKTNVDALYTKVSP